MGCDVEVTFWVTLVAHFLMILAPFLELVGPPVGVPGPVDLKSFFKWILKVGWAPREGAQGRSNEVRGG